jgi:hypothetical protein
VLPACSATASLAAAVLAPPLVAFGSILVSLVLLVLGQFLWQLLEDEDAGR